ncbi:hypothetical protein SAMN05216462_1336 [Xylanibacter ruminicola]|uniref:Uncharacterized protein n=1 Tax=Xylanibacter ruminicola TaxID=839 RepID=A0A1H4AS33_XYLRU|nr:hypothetical protein SAMN05216462_1336 [Xylanibacter ruminicola]
MIETKRTYYEWAHKHAQNCVCVSKWLIINILTIYYHCTNPYYCCAIRYLFVQIIIFVQDLCSVELDLCRSSGIFATGLVPDL